MNTKKKPVYLNLRGPYGVETVDEFTRGEDAPENPREFRAYVREMVSNYHQSRMPVYTSSRCTREWSQR
jgi:hypothetical protein